MGIVDFTRGELGSRGTPAIREQEAARASEILGISARENLGLPDGNIENTDANRRLLIRSIRRYRPHVLLINAPDDRHPDHAAAARLSIEAAFYSGLRMLKTYDAGEPQAPHRPAHVLHYMQSVPFEPTLVVDVSSTWETRVKAMEAFSTQFYNPEHDEDGGPTTFISDPEFWNWIEARARTLGYRIGATYGEGFLYHHGPLGVTDLLATLGDRRV